MNDHDRKYVRRLLIAAKETMDWQVDGELTDTEAKFLLELSSFLELDRAEQSARAMVDGGFYIINDKVIDI